MPTSDETTPEEGPTRSRQELLQRVYQRGQALRQRKRALIGVPAAVLVVALVVALPSIVPGSGPRDQNVTAGVPASGGGPGAPGRPGSPSTRFTPGAGAPAPGGGGTIVLPGPTTTLIPGAPAAPLPAPPPADQAPAGGSSTAGGTTTGGGTAAGGSTSEPSADEGATTESGSAAAGPAVSGSADPASGTIVFTRYVNGNSEIFVVAVGGSAENLTSNSAADGDPSWSAGGSRIVFTSSRGAALPGTRGIHVMAPDGSGVTALTRDFDDSEPTWSARDEIAFTRSPAGPVKTEGPSIWVMRSDGSGLRRLYDGATSPAWSPDGSRLAFVSGGQVWVSDAAGTDAHQIGPGVEPSWSPDGSLLAVVRDGDVHVVAPDDPSAGSTAVTTTPASERWPSWSPDGGFIAVATSDGSTSQIQVISADGASRSTVTDGELDERPRFAPD